MDGGKIINEGAYGCIYHPSLQCAIDIQNRDIRMKQVNKLQLYNEYAINEAEIGKKVSQIKDYESRFVPMLEKKNSSCSTLKIKQFEHKVLKKCDLLDKNTPETKVLLLEGKYIHDGISLRDVLSSQKKESDYVFHFVSIFLHIIESIEILLQNRIIHFDLRNPNILYDPLKKIPLILDFGISFTVEDMLKYPERVFIGYDPSYYIYPPEVLFLSHFIFDNKHDNTFNTLKDVYKDIYTNDLYEMLPIDVRKQYQYDLLTYFKQLSETTNFQKSKQSQIHDLLQYQISTDSFHSWDIYIFAVFMLRILHESQGSNPYKEELYLLCYDCIHPNPNRRPPISDLKIHCEQILLLFRDHKQQLNQMTHKSKKVGYHQEQYSLRDKI